MAQRYATFLFACGSFRQPDVQVRVFGRILDGTPDALPGFARRRRVAIEEAAAIDEDVPLFVTETGDPDDQIEGTVLSVTEKDLAIADAFEPPDFRRVSVRLASGLAAWVYLKV